MKFSVEKLEALMAEQGLTYTELGKRGASASTVKTARRRGTANPKTVGKIANALGVTVDELTTEPQKQEG